MNKGMTMKKYNKINLLWIFSFAVTANVNAAVFTVDEIFDGADAAPGDGVCATQKGNCTLRAAIMEANALDGADEIIIPSGRYTLVLGGNNEDSAAEGDLDILDDLTITGEDADTTILTGNVNKFRIFSILEREDGGQPVVKLNKLTLTQGLESSIGSLIYNEGNLFLDDVTLTEASANSVALMSKGALSIRNSRITNNFQGVSSSGDLTIRNSLFSSNSNNSGFSNGAALILIGGSATIEDSSFTENKAARGAAIYQNNRDILSIANSSFSANESDHGGAIFVAGVRDATDIFDSRFTQNSADRGGAIFSFSTLRIRKSAFRQNQSTYEGGALYINIPSSSVASIVDTIIANNIAGSLGGGVYLSGHFSSSSSLIFRNSEISGNSAQRGGGIYSVSGGHTFQNLTISGNTADIEGGGLYQNANGDNTIELIHSTVAGNASPVDTASNIYNQNGIIRLSNTIIADPVNGKNCGGDLTTLGYNLSSDATCGLGVEGDQIDTDPLLSPLADNGGFTRTMALRETSPAIDAGNKVACAAYNPIDQRYYYRSDGACDIGAYEYGSEPAQTGTLGFSTETYSVGEADGTITVTVSRTGGSEGVVSVLLMDTQQGTASRGLYSWSRDRDYDRFEPTRLEWADGDSSDKSIDITIIDDAAYEGDETIELELGSMATVYGGANLGATKATVTIVEDDVPGKIQFSSSAYRVDENARYVQIFVERIDGSSPVSIDYATSDGTASAGTDYTAASGTLNFASGADSRYFFVYITNNGVVDGDRTINLTLSNPQGGLALGDPVQAVLTIVDDDVNRGTISFDQAEYTVSEDVGQLILTLNRTNGSVGNVSVDVSLQNDTALHGSDFSGRRNFTLTFADGEESASVTIPIMDDDAAESRERFTIEIGAPQGGATLGAITQVEVEITDNDSAPGTPEFGFASNNDPGTSDDPGTSNTPGSNSGFLGSVDFLSILISLALWGFGRRKAAGESAASPPAKALENIGKVEAERVCRA